MLRNMKNSLEKKLVYKQELTFCKKKHDGAKRIFLQVSYIRELEHYVTLTGKKT